MRQVAGAGPLELHEVNSFCLDHKGAGVCMCVCHVCVCMCIREGDTALETGAVICSFSARSDVGSVRTSHPFLAFGTSSYSWSFVPRLSSLLSPGVNVQELSEVLSIEHFRVQWKVHG